MNPSKRHLAIIPARSGSKGVTDKNIRLLGGIPLLAWSIQAAVKCRLFDRIILSTDNPEYAQIGKQYGAEAPWLRDKRLAADDTPTAEVIIDLLDRLEGEGQSFTFFTLLQPTSPLRTREDIMAAWSLLLDKEAEAIVSVCPCDHPPLWCNTLPPDGSLKEFLRPDVMVPRQQLPEQYRVNGAIYMVLTRSFRAHRTFFTPKSYALVMPRERSVDIDDETDFILAEAIINRNKKSLHG